MHGASMVHYGIPSRCPETMLAFGALLVIMFSAFEEAKVQGVPPSMFGLAFVLKDETEEDVGGIAAVSAAMCM